MADEFTILADINNVKLAEDTRRGQATFTVTNKQAQSFKGRAELELFLERSSDERGQWEPLKEEASAWLSLEGDATHDFEVAGIQSYSVKIQLPPTARAGKYILRLNMVGLDIPEEQFTEGPTVTFSVSAPVQPAKRPFPWWIVAAVIAVLAIGGGLVYFLSNRAADLSVNVTTPVDSVVAGENLSYVIEVTNNGPGSAAGLVLTDTLPVEATFLSASLASCQSDEIDGLVVCPLAELAAEESTTIEVQVQVDGAARDTLDNTVFIGGESAAAEVSGLNTIDVTPEVALSVDFSGPASVEADGQLVYTAVTHNNGPSQATEVFLIYQPPPNALGTNIVGQEGACQPQDQAFLCALGSLGAGDEKSVTITLVPGPESIGSLTAAVTAVSNESTPTTSPAVTTDIQPVTGLSVIIELLTPAIVSQPLKYAIKVWNNNPNRQAKDVVMRYFLPEGVEIQGIPPDCLQNETLVQCNLSQVGSGIDIGKRIELDLLPTRAGDLMSRVEVESGNFPSVTANQSTHVERSFGSTGVIFNGDSAWVELSDFDIPETFTLEMWVTPKSNKNGQAFVGKHTSQGSNIFLVGYWDGGLYVNLREKNYTAGAKLTELYHLAVVVEKQTLAQSLVTVYQNGETLWTNEFASVLGDDISGKPWVFGQDWDENNRTDFYNGILTEVRIWDHARSQAEIQADMNVRLSGDEAGLIGYWPLDARSGETASDKSGHGRDGTLRDGATWVGSRGPIVIPGQILGVLEKEIQNPRLAPILITPTPGFHIIEENIQQP